MFSTVALGERDENEWIALYVAVPLAAALTFMILILCLTTACLIYSKRKRNITKIFDQVKNMDISCHLIWHHYYTGIQECPALVDGKD